MTKSRSGKRIGPQMQRAAALVAANPGCSKKFVAERISPLAGYGTQAMNWALGYEPVNRAIAADLIDAVKLPSGRYALYVSG